MEESNSSGSGREDDPETDRYTVTHDWDADDSPSLSVIETVAAVAGTDPTAMRSLYEVIDVDALDKLFEPTVGSSHRRANGRVTFRYEGCDVTVEADGRTVVTPTDVDDR